MFKRGRVKPSKSSSLFGMVVGLIFVIIGFTTIVPAAGPFGILWTLFALAITGFHGYNFFSETGPNPLAAAPPVSIIIWIYRYIMERMNPISSMFI